jgi:hypothetical protein
MMAKEEAYIIDALELLEGLVNATERIAMSLGAILGKEYPGPYCCDCYAGLVLDEKHSYFCPNCKKEKSSWRMTK